MKATKMILALSLAVAALGNASANPPSTLLNTRMWTDRNATNPAFATQPSTINDSIGHFWNLPDAPPPAIQPTTTHVVEHRSSRGRHTTNTYHSTPAPQPRNQLTQNQQSNERRGFLGINLFNLIPIVDIVYGNAASSSSDHVVANK